MNTATQLKVQAYLDNELSPAEARQVASLISSDSEARLVYSELKDTKEILAGNESPATLPDSPDFYWSQIQRRIAAEEKIAPRTTPTPWWMKLLAPAAGAIALFAALLSIQGPSVRPTGSSDISAMHEIENNPQMSTITFRSESEGVTVVWVSANDTAASDADPFE